MLTDQALIAQCAKNDSKAHNLLFERYKERVMGICVRYLGDRDEAKDIFQEVFIKIFASIKKEKGKIVSLEKWITTITVRLAINHYHKQRRGFDALDQVDTNTPILSDSELNIIARLDAEKIYAIIQRLPLGYRMVFNLYLIEGFSHKEISEILKISESASRSQLTRAKSLVRAEITQLEKIAL